MNAIMKCAGPDIKIVSFDIFDTLLLRGMSYPSQLFQNVYYKAPELFPEYMNEEDWQHLRAAGEAFADMNKKMCHEVVKFKDIYNILPAFIENKDEILKLELECEKEFCYINAEIDSTIKALHKQGKKIILTSDMYLGREEIEEILLCNGFDFCCIDDIYVSSDYNTSKKTGGLFNVIMNKYNIKPFEMLHVGDNIRSDIATPSMLGIKTYFYDTISDSLYNFPYLMIEDLKYGEICPELFSLRNIVAASNPYKGDDAEWYNMGCMILGPVFTAFIEWVLDTAMREKINQVFPIMREGEFFSELLIAAQSFRNKKIKIQKLYCSRKALYESILNIIEKRDLKVIIHSDLLTIQDVLKLFHIEDLLPDEFANNINDNIRKSEEFFDKFYAWISQDAIINEIRKRNKNSDNLLMDYLKELGFESPYITLDIGWRGSVGNGIQRMMQNQNMKVRNLNLLMCGRLDAIPNVLDNCMIWGYIGSFGKNLSLIRRDLFVRVFECFLLCTEGTTVGYKRDEGTVVPITKEINYHPDQIKNIRICQEGILMYQRKYLEMKQKKSWISKSEKEPENLCKIMARLFTMPLYKEAKMLGSLQFDQNLGVNVLRDIVSEEIFNEYNYMNPEDFFSKRNHREVEWYSGMNVLKDPFYHFELIFRLNNMYSELQIIFFIRRILSSSSLPLMIVGAGGTGRKILRYLKVANQEKRVIGFLDNSSELQMVRIMGKKVYKFDMKLNQCEFIIGTMNPKLQVELVKDLLKARGHSVKYYSFFDDEGICDER